MKILNSQYRGMDKTTDVLSFPLLCAKEQKFGRAKASLSRSMSGTSELDTPDRSLPLGDIVVNLHKAKRQSAENGISFNEEINRLLIHGLLHLVGYDHEQSAYLRSKMEKKEVELLGSTK
jgi:probable rRNA maturation factor